MTRKYETIYSLDVPKKLIRALKNNSNWSKMIKDGIDLKPTKELWELRENFELEVKQEIRKLINADDPDTIERAKIYAEEIEELFMEIENHFPSVQEFESSLGIKLEEYFTVEDDFGNDIGCENPMYAYLVQYIQIKDFFEDSRDVPNLFISSYEEVDITERVGSRKINFNLSVDDLTCLLDSLIEVGIIHEGHKKSFYELISKISTTKGTDHISSNRMMKLSSKTTASESLKELVNKLSNKIYRS